MNGLYFFLTESEAGNFSDCAYSTLYYALHDGNAKPLMQAPDSKKNQNLVSAVVSHEWIDSQEMTAFIKWRKGSQ